MSQPSPVLPFYPRGGAIRNAAPRDLAELARLCAGDKVDMRLFDAAHRHPFGHLLVFELDGAIRAATYVVIDEAHGLRARLELLLVDPAVARARKSIEDRMIGVASALCEAYGCVALDILPSTRNDDVAVRYALGR